MSARKSSVLLIPIDFLLIELDKYSKVVIDDLSNLTQVLNELDYRLKTMGRLFSLKSTITNPIHLKQK